MVRSSPRHLIKLSCWVTVSTKTRLQLTKDPTKVQGNLSAGRHRMGPKGFPKAALWGTEIEMFRKLKTHWMKGVKMDSLYRSEAVFWRLILARFRLQGTPPELLDLDFNQHLLSDSLRDLRQFTQAREAKAPKTIHHPFFTTTHSWSEATSASTVPK